MFLIENRVWYFCLLDQISIEELDVIYKIPHCVPISAHHKWNFDDVLEKMWEYLKLVRMWVPKNPTCRENFLLFFLDIRNLKASYPITVLRLSCTRNTQQWKISATSYIGASQRSLNSNNPPNPITFFLSYNSMHF